MPFSLGSFLEVQDAKIGRDIWLHPLDGNGTAPPLLQSRFNEFSGRVSPNGRWLAYASDESGQNEIYLQAFPDLGDKRGISTSGGLQPVWSREGSELFYRGPEALMTVEIHDGPPFVAGTPQALFEDRFLRAQGGLEHTSYDVAPDGRFLMLEAGTSPAAGSKWS